MKETEECSTEQLTEFLNKLMILQSQAKGEWEEN